MRRASEVAEAVLVVVPVEGVVAVGVVVSLSLLLLREVSRGPVGGGLGAVVDSLVESVAVGATAAGGSGAEVASLVVLAAVLAGALDGLAPLLLLPDGRAGFPCGGLGLWRD